MSRVFRLLLLVASSVMLIGATPQLNPLVQRLPQPSRSAPAECEEGLSAIPVEPRPVLEDIPLPEVRSGEALSPPSATLRSQLAAVQHTLETADRAGFDASLAALRRTLADYPRGGERTAAEAALQVYDDARRVWDAQFEAPFFSRESDLYRALSRYPGYEDAVRRQLLAGQYYPARESRDFLATLARARVAEAGVRAGTTTSRRPQLPSDDAGLTALPPVKPRASVREVAPSPARASRPTVSGSRASSGGSAATTRRSSASDRTTAAPRVARTPSASGSPAASRSSARHTSPTRAAGEDTPAAPRAASSSPTPAPPLVSDPIPPDVDLAPSTTGVVSPTDAFSTPGDSASAPTTTDGASTAGTDSALSGATSTESSTIASPATETASSSEAAPVERSRARKIIIPALLVLVGIIILVMLFRAS